MKTTMKTGPFCQEDKYNLVRQHAELVLGIETDVSAIEHILGPIVEQIGTEPKDKALSALAAEVLRRVHRANHNGRRACILGRMISANEARKA